MTTKLDRLAEAVPDSVRANRRVILKAGALFSAMAATWGVQQLGPEAAAAQQATGKTKRQRWSQAENSGGVTAADADGFRTVTAQFPFYAIGASWAGTAGTSPQIELHFANGGAFGGAVIVA